MRIEKVPDSEWGDLQGRGNHFEMKSLGNKY